MKVWLGPGPLRSTEQSPYQMRSTEERPPLHPSGSGGEVDSSVDPVIMLTTIITLLSLILQELKIHNCEGVI